MPPKKKIWNWNETVRVFFSHVCCVKLSEGIRLWGLFVYNLRTCLILYLLARLKLGWVVGATFFPRSRNSRPAQTLFFPPRELGGGRQLPFLYVLHHFGFWSKDHFGKSAFCIQFANKFLWQFSPMAWKTFWERWTSCDSTESPQLLKRQKRNNYLSCRASSFCFKWLRVVLKSAKNHVTR